MKEKKTAIIQQSNRLSNEKDTLERLERNALIQVVRGLQEKYPIIKDGEGISLHAYDTANIKDEIITVSEDRLVECLGSRNKNGKHNLRSVKEALQALRKKSCDIPPELRKDDWITVGWINYAKYNADTKEFSVQVSSEIIPFLLNQTAKFTKFDAYYIFDLENKYSQRFYIKCCQFKEKGFFTMTEDEIRERFCVYKTVKGTDVRLNPLYKNASQFRKNVLDKAKNELKEKFDNGLCDCYFDYVATEWARGDQHPTKWFFAIGYKGHKADLTRGQKQSKQIEVTPKEQNIFSDNDFSQDSAKETRSEQEQAAISNDYNIQFLTQCMRNWFANDVNFQGKVTRELTKMSVEKVKEVLEHAQRISRDHTGEDRIKILRHMLNQDVLKIKAKK